MQLHRLNEHAAYDRLTLVSYVVNNPPATVAEADYILGMDTISIIK
jgi:hypothetical protein